VSFRDDLSAAQARIAALERELAGLRKGGGVSDEEVRRAAYRRINELGRELEVERARNQDLALQLSNAYQAHNAAQTERDVLARGAEEARAEAVVAREPLERELAATRARLAELDRQLGELREQGREPRGVIAGQPRRLARVEVTQLTARPPCCAAALGRPLEVDGADLVWDLELAREGAAWIYKRGSEEGGAHVWRELWLRERGKEQRIWRSRKPEQVLRAPLLHDPGTASRERVVVPVHEGKAGWVLVLLDTRGLPPRTLCERAMEEVGCALGPLHPSEPQVVVRCVGKLETLSLDNLATVAEWPGPEGWTACDAHWSADGGILAGAYLPRAGARPEACRMMLYAGTTSWDLGPPLPSARDLACDLPAGYATTVRLPALGVEIALRVAG